MGLGSWVLEHCGIRVLRFKAFRIRVLEHFGALKLCESKVFGFAGLGSWVLEHFGTRVLEFEAF